MRNAFALFLALAVLAPVARAGVAEPLPLVIPHQGRLLDGSDNPVEGPLNLTFLIYDVEVDTPSNHVAAVWSGKYSVTVSRGLYAVDIGDTRGTLSAPLTPAFFAGGRKLWLAVKIGDGAELTPRARVGAVPYAYLAGEALHANEADHAKTSDAVADGAVSTAKLVDGAVTTAKIGAQQVTTALVAAQAITTDLLANGAVTAAQLAEKTVTAAQLADKTVTAAQLADKTVTAAQLADAAVTVTQLADGAVSNAKLGAGSLTVDRFAPGQVGTSAGMLAAGDHNHDAVYSKLGHTHPAADVTGTLGYAQLPADVARTANGSLLAARTKASSLYVSSAGNNFSGGASATVVLDRTQYNGVSRGLNVLQIKRSDHSVVGGAFQGFDTYADPTASASLVTLLNGIATDKIVIVSALDEASVVLSAAAKLALKRCGAQKIDQIGVRDSYLLVGICGAPTSPAYELLRPSSDAGGAGGGPVEAQFELVDGLLGGVAPLKAGVFSPSRRSFGLTQSGAYKKMSNFDDLAFRSSGGPVAFGLSVQMNDDIGIPPGTTEWVSQGCRLRIDAATTAARIVDLGMDQRYGAYNYQWTYSYTSVVQLPPGMHAAYLECEITRSGAAANMNAMVGGRGFEAVAGWVLAEPQSGANSANQDSFWAQEL